MNIPNIIWDSSLKKRWYVRWFIFTKMNLEKTRAFRQVLIAEALVFLVF